ncbi:MAG: hypothetical protein QG654_68 [Patescibacteria group bacterium]|nr:hypothetical protein [Patescibacteria group bacterium]
MEKFDQELKKHKPELFFEKKSFKPDAISYVFKNVIVTIDRSGKNYTRLPEVQFGTFDDEPTRDSFKKPESKREGVDMVYVTSCIKEALNDDGLNEFWIYPFGDDDPENKERREDARVRLFQKYFNLEPAENNFGYIIKI